MIDDLLKLGPNQEVGNQPLHARSIENHKSAVDWEPWLPCRSVHPFSQSRLKRPLSRSTIPTGLAIRAPCPRAPDHYVSRCSRSLLPLPGPRRSLSLAVIPVHAVPGLGRSLSRFRRPLPPYAVPVAPLGLGQSLSRVRRSLPFPTAATCDSEHFSARSRVVAAIR